MADGPSDRPMVSIIVKALNEERRIRHCLEAAIDEASQVDGEVILVDSLSTDRTVELASQYHRVQIVQFLDARDVNCGAAVQLGYQRSKGDYIYVLDADMVLQSGFIQHALQILSKDSKLAGVGGKIIDTRVRTLADRRRVAHAESLTSDRFVGELGGGGLYKREAIEAVSYLSNRYLRAYEEADLGARLHSKGWKLLRTSRPAVVHEGHLESNWQMLVRLWRNGRAAATGAFMRSSLSEPWFHLVVRKLSHVYALIVIHVGQLLPIIMVPREQAFTLWVGYWLTVLIFLTLKKRGLKDAVWSLTLANYLLFASVYGFFSKMGNPGKPIACNIIRDGGNAALRRNVS